MAKHFLLPDVEDCAIFDPSTEFMLSLSKCSGQVIRSWPHFAQSHTSGNRSNRAILLFGALLMGVLPHSVRQDDR